MEHFSPQGSNVSGKQVIARFSAPMVGFGDPRQAAPFAIDCPAAGQGRWLDDRQWVYDFESELTSGIRCGFTLRKDLSSLAGLRVEGETRFSFDTGGPRLKAVMPATRIEEDQIFVLLPDAGVGKETLADKIFFEVEGLAEKVPAVLMEGGPREEFLSRLKQGPVFGNWRFVGEYTREERKKVSLKSDKLAGQLLVVQCQRPFPPGKKVTLVWDAGIASPNGLKTREPQRLQFEVAPLVRATMECERTSEKADCVPITPIALRFSDPIPRSWSEQIQLVAADGTTWKPRQPDEQEEVNDLTFVPPFPEKTQLEIRLPQGIADSRGRPLANARRFPLKFKTATYPPLAKFPASFGILERNAEPILPVAVRNLEANVQARLLSSGREPSTGQAPDIQGRNLQIQDDAEIIAWIKRLRQHRPYAYETSLFADRDKAIAFTVPKPGGDQAFELVGIPLTPGFHVVELASPKLGEVLFGRPGVYHVNTAALVTNLAVHLKYGAESSLVWVTALESAKPVAGAQVRISGLDDAKLLWEGLTGQDGTTKVPAGVLPADKQKMFWQRPRELLVSARQNDDLSFVLSSWDDGIAPYEFGLDLEFFRSYDWHVGGNADWSESYGFDRSLIGHTVFDRPLFRTGETVHMKHLLRQGTEKGFANSPEENRFAKLVISHQGSGQRYELPLSFAGGVAINEWKIPEAAKLGTYRVAYQADKDKSESTLVPAGSFRVAEFRVPTMRGEIRLPARALVNPAATQLDLAVRYLSGGPAANLPVKVRTQATDRPVFFPDYPEFSFLDGDVKEGLVERTPRYDEDEETAAVTSPARAIPATLDSAGAARITVDDLPSKPVAQTLSVELEYQDPNGEVLTVADRAPIWPSGVVLGFRLEDEEIQGKKGASFPVLALDTTGKPLAGQEIEVDLFREIYHVSRKRLVGGFYSYDYKEEINRVSRLCKGRTDPNGLLACEAASPPAGSYIIRAKSTDAAGNVSVTRRYVYSYGEDFPRWYSADSDRMDLVTGKRSYAPGETARFEVHLPFKEATALVSVEREGVLDAYVVPIAGENPVVEVPIKPNYGPNVFVSVLAVRGRIGAPAPTALVDLARPAFRLGYCRINVGWQGYGLEVKVTSPREVYRTRDQAELRLKVRGPDGALPPAGTELAVAAVDEGLLELMPNRSWKLLESMMQPRRIQVDTATAQMQVVGKRHYGRKAIPGGGGGGRQPTRELFDTLLLWSPRVTLDARGEASLKVPLNDALTSFRIAAVANGESVFGTGELSIRTSQEVMLHAGLPSLVRSGDRFQGTVTVRNGSDRPLALEVDGEVIAEDRAGGAGASQPLTRQSLELAPGEARELAWPMTVPDNSGRLIWSIAAEEQVKAGSKAKPVRDELKIAQTVQDPHPVRTMERVLNRLDSPVTIPVMRPADARPDKGGIDVAFSPRLGGGMGDLEDFMAQYPYSCLEQRVSKAVALASPAALNKIVADLPSYLDKDGLLRFFPCEWCEGSPVLSSYVLAISQEAGFALPEFLRMKIIEGLGGFVQGKIKRDSWLARVPDLSLRKLMAIEALSRYPGAAKPAMLSFPVVAADLPMASLLDWIGILRRLEGVDSRQHKLEEALALVHSRLYASGGTLSLPQKQGFWWLLNSVDTTAVRTVLTMLAEESWQPEVGRLMQGVLNKQKKGHWDTTMANAWGRLLVDKFSARFEAIPPEGESRARLGDEARDLTWQSQPDGAILNFAWPAARQDLHLEHQGQGAPWVSVASRAALVAAGDQSNGYTIERTVTPVEQAVPGTWGRADVVRVHLAMTAQTNMGWVVVEDPIPAGATILGRGLQRDSQMLAAARTSGGIRPAFEEAGQDSFRAYYQEVPAGKWELEYTLRLNTSGEFILPPSRVEAMYAPELFAEKANPAMVITEPRQ